MKEKIADIDILEEKENIKLEDKYKQTLKMAKEVMEDVSERNNGCEPSKSECLAYNMQYVKKYVETLIAENKELKEIVETLRKENVEAMIQRRQYELHYIPKSKIEVVKEKIMSTLKIGENVPVWKICMIDNFLQSLLGKE